ncbi:hypothetical protein STEG23_006349, partial [Scotinomys teguina]
AYCNVVECSPHWSKMMMPGSWYSCMDLFFRGQLQSVLLKIPQESAAELGPVTFV